MLFPSCDEFVLVQEVEDVCTAGVEVGAEKDLVQFDLVFVTTCAFVTLLTTGPAPVALELVPLVGACILLLASAAFAALPVVK